MAFPKSIFKAYDIRGVYPDELDEALAYRIGRSFAVFLQREMKKERLRLVVCQDMRASSPSLKKEIVRGMVEQGIEVVDIGLASTPTFYFGVAYYGYDGGIQVTASHNPAKYNGCKMVRARAVPISGNTGMAEIARLSEMGEWDPASRPGSIISKEGVLQEQIQYALTHGQVKKIKPLKIVVDAANGMGALLMQELFQHLPISLTSMFFDLDGNFPNHEADPLKDENNKMLQDTVVESGADLGIALDGDADRIFFIDNTGKTINPAIMRGILAQIFLREHPGAPICYDVRPGKITVDMITEAGGRPVVTKVGHSLIKEKAREVGAVFAGESSGHFFVNTPHGFFEMPEIITLKFLEELSESGKTAAEYVAPLERYAHSGEINFSVADKQAVFDRLRQEYSDHLQYDFDGLTFEYPDWWFNVRESNTENKVRLNLEGMNKSIVEEKVKEVSGVIQQV